MQFDGGRWEEVEGSWVLVPPNADAGGGGGATLQPPPERLIHFIGGAFVGASPQLSYRSFLEKLCERGRAIVIATPYALLFDQLRCAEEAQFRYDRCLRELCSPSPKVRPETAAALASVDIEGLPSFGVGHSLGSLLHLMIGSRYATGSPGAGGNVLLSFNNKPVAEAVPVFWGPFAPLTSSAAGVIEQVRKGPLGGAADLVTESLKSASPPLVRQILPLVEQVQPLIAEVSAGASDFMPPPEESRRLIRQYYGVNRNMLIKFREDSIDETPELAQLLQTKSAISGTLDLTVKTLGGDHVRPLQIDPAELSMSVPPELTTVAETGTSILNRLVDMADGAGIDARSTAPLRDIASMSSDLASGLRGGGGGGGGGGEGEKGASADGADARLMELVDIIVDWMDSGMRQQRMLKS